MDLLKDLQNRGLVNNITNKQKADEFFKSKKFGMYIGFDPSAKSLHLGNYLAISILKRFSLYGYKTVAVLGGATGMIGDPSGKNSERSLLNKDVLNKNKVCIKKQLKKLTSAEIFDNYEIYKNMNILDFLRDVGKSINVNHILEKDIVKRRLETGLSYTEFSYSIMQGYDFWYLYKNKNVALQIGGSDQWSNITSGVDFIRKDEGEKSHAFGLTINLLTKSDGTKFGKSESGAIYLDKEITSPYQMYQFLINQSDEDIEKLFYYFSFKDIKEINKIITNHKKEPFKKIAQNELTKELIITIHGKKEYDNVLKISQAIFRNEIEKLTEEELLVAFSSVPTYEIVSTGMNIIDLLVLGICSSKREARELVDGGSIHLNGKKIESKEFVVTSKDSYSGKFSIIRKGKKSYFLVKFI